MKTCPVCRGEKTSWGNRKETCLVCVGAGEIHDEDEVGILPKPMGFMQRLLWTFESVTTTFIRRDGSYAFITAYAIVVSIALLIHETMQRPPKPEPESAELQCSRACGPGRFKSWTVPIAPWTERTKDGAPNIAHDGVAGKCECLDASRAAPVMRTRCSPSGDCVIEAAEVK